MKWFPNGLGTRAFLAFGIVGTGMALDVISLMNSGKDMGLTKAALPVILTAYFVDKANRNGNGNGNGS